VGGVIADSSARRSVTVAHDHTEAAAVQRSSRVLLPKKGSYPGTAAGLERTRLSPARMRRLRKLSTRHHVANRGRVPLPAAWRIDPARVQGLGDLP
jgi:hypothetical protein